MARLTARESEPRDKLKQLDEFQGRWVKPRAARDRLSLAGPLAGWLGDETPQVLVEVKPFYPDTHEVTVAEYQAYCKATDKEMPWPDRSCPAGNSSSNTFIEVTHPISVRQTWLTLLVIGVLREQRHSHSPKAELY